MDIQDHQTNIVEKAHDTPENIVEMEAMRELLRRMYGVESLFVRVKLLSRILGLPPATVYTAMREGRFFLPHRVVCAAPMVSVIDLVRWLTQTETMPSMARKHAEVAAADALRSGSGAMRADAVRSSSDSAKQTRRRLISETMQRLRAEANGSTK